MKDIKLAIVGATGLVGRTVLKVLEEKNLHISEYVLFASSKSAGKRIEFMNQFYTVQELNELSFNSGFDYAIFCAGGYISEKYAPIAVSKGCIVIDNSSTYRMNENVPLIVPEVNLKEINNNCGIIANPNCSTIQAVIALKPLDDKYKIKRIVYSTYQAVSGAGRQGILDLENGIKNYLTDKNYKQANPIVSNSDNEFCESSVCDITDFSFSSNYELNKFSYPIFSNCLPHIDIFLDNGYTKEEEKMINETRKILNKPDLKITATAVRVPVFNSHSEAINVEFENSFDIDELVNTLANSPGIEIQDNIINAPDVNTIKEPIYPLATSSTGHDKVFVGRIRRDYSVDSGINLWVVSDNIRKGAATNAVQIVENLIRLREH